MPKSKVKEGIFKYTVKIYCLPKHGEYIHLYALQKSLSSTIKKQFKDLKLLTAFSSNSYDSSSDSSSESDSSKNGRKPPSNADNKPFSNTDNKKSKKSRKLPLIIPSSNKDDTSEDYSSSGDDDSDSSVNKTGEKIYKAELSFTKEHKNIKDALLEAFPSYIVITKDCVTSFKPITVTAYIIELSARLEKDGSLFALSHGVKRNILKEFRHALLEADISYHELYLVKGNETLGRYKMHITTLGDLNEINQKWMNDITAFIEEKYPEEELYKTTKMSMMIENKPDIDEKTEYKDLLCNTVYIDVYAKPNNIVIKNDEEICKILMKKVDNKDIQGLTLKQLEAPEVDKKGHPTYHLMLCIETNKEKDAIKSILSKIFKNGILYKGETMTIVLEE